MSLIKFQCCIERDNRMAVIRLYITERRSGGGESGPV